MKDNDVIVETLKPAIIFSKKTFLKEMKKRENELKKTKNSK